MRKRLHGGSYRPWIIMAAACVVIVSLVITIVTVSRAAPRTVALNVSPRDTTVTFNRGVLQLRNDLLVFHDAKARETDFATTTPASKLLSNSRFAASWNPEHVSFFNTQGNEVYTHTYTATDSRIYAVRMGQQIFGVLTKTADGVTRITQHTPSGVPVDDYDFGKKTVSDFGFYGNPVSMWVTILDSANQTPTNQLLVYGKARSLLASITLYGEVAVRVLPMLDNILVVGTSHIFLYNYAGELQPQQGTTTGSRSIQGWKPVGIGGTDPQSPYVLLAPVQAQGEPERPLQNLWIYSHKAQSNPITLPADSHFGAAGDQSFWVYAGRTLYTYRYNGRQVRARRFEFEITGMQLIPGSKQAVLTAGDAVYLVSVG